MMKTRRTTRRVRCLWAMTLLMMLPLHGLAVDRGRQVVVTKPDDAAGLMDAVENAIWAAGFHALPTPRPSAAWPTTRA